MTEQEIPAAVSSDDFNGFVRGLDYPMFVVTTSAHGERSGCLVGFTTQVSIDPPRMLVCLSEKNHTYGVARRAPVLAVHGLGPDQHPLAELFGEQTGDEVDKFDHCSWEEGPAGVPLLTGCPRRFVGRVLEQHPLGDHVGFVLEPVAVTAPTGEHGLTLEDMGDMEPGHDA